MDKVKPNGNQTEFPTQDCATINHVPNYVNIENCANHPEGNTLSPGILHTLATSLSDVFQIYTL